MSLAVLALLASPHVTLPVCAWDKPGHNRFTGDVAGAVRHYADLPAPVAKRLQERIRARDFDDMVEIRRDSIEGRSSYEPELRDMHFGTGQICRTITRSSWTENALERGMVYCEGSHCLIVPTVCGNLSRVTRRDAPVAGRTGGTGLPGAGEGLPALPASPLIAATPDTGPSFDDLQDGDGGGLDPASTPVVTVASGPDDRFTTQLPLPDGRGPGWPTFGDDERGGASFGAPVVGFIPLPAVPEPASGLLAALGLAGLWGWYRRSRARAAQAV